VIPFTISVSHLITAHIGSGDERRAANTEISEFSEDGTSGKKLVQRLAWWDGNSQKSPD
jgi:hypothetical protein